MMYFLRQMTRYFSESCTYIRDAPDIPPAVAMEGEDVNELAGGEYK